MKVLLVLTLLAVAAGISQADTCSYVDKVKRCWLNIFCYYVQETKYEYCIHGGFSEWVESSRSACSKSCGTGTQTVTKDRTCTNPTPQGRLAKDCAGSKSMTVTTQCNTQPCPLDGGWTDWTNWEDTTKCSALCGGGTLVQTHKRSCTNPAPKDGGKNCVGEAIETRDTDCNTDACAERCPEAHDTYITADDDSHYYFRCLPGDEAHPTKAVRMECPQTLVWDQSVLTCVQPPQPKPVSTCTEGAMRVDPQNCSVYLVCVNGKELSMSCPTGLKFNSQAKVCDFAQNVIC